MQTSQKFVIIYDTETGGLPNKEKPAFTAVPLIEVSFVVVDMLELEIVDELDIMLERDYLPNFVYTPEAEAVHGITENVQREKGIKVQEGFKLMKALFTKYKNPRLKCSLVGHNSVAFDTPFLRNWFEHCGDNLDNYVLYHGDTMQLCQWAALEQERYNLPSCLNVYGIENDDAHRAAADTIATAKLFIEMMKKLRGVGAAADTAEKKPRYREKFQIEK